MALTVLNSPADSETAPLASFARFATVARQGGELSVVFFGGSLTWGAGATDPQRTSWRAVISRRLKEEFPGAKFEFWDAAIGGTGSQLGAFRLERDVFAKKPDLVFLDFTLNDNPYEEPVPDRLASYESVVRRLVERGVPVVQVILPSRRDVTDAVLSRPLDPVHKSIATAYGVPSVDVVSAARSEVQNGKTAADALWDIPEDATHPGDAGYELYARSVWTVLAQSLMDGVSCHLPGRMIHPKTYLSVNRARLSMLGTPPRGWKRGLPHRNALAYDFVCSRWMDEVMIARGEENPGSWQFEVEGESLIIFGEATPVSGEYEVRVDDKVHRYNANSPDGNMRLVQMVATGLEPGRKHRVEIIPKLAPGRELRLESLCVAGGRALVKQ